MATTPPEGETPAVQPEYVIAKALSKRLEAENSLLKGEREGVAYRISEIMVCAKDLYTRALPRLLNEAPGESGIEEEISGLRMTLLHMRDLVTEFDSVFLEAMFHERQGAPDQVYDQWQPDEEWTAEDLGVSPEDMED
jgi:hypothetical protein